VAASAAAFGMTGVFGPDAERKALGLAQAACVVGSSLLAPAHAAAT
jgi:hypothetical protein